MITKSLHEIRKWLPDAGRDAHRDLEKNHGPHAAAIDKPIAGLLTDLKSRGLLDQTLVVWTSEFGRTSYGQSGNGVLCIRRGSLFPLYIAFAY